MHRVPHDPGALGEVLNWIDPRFGPIRSFHGVELGAPHPRWWVYTGFLARYPIGNWFGGFPAGAAGVSIDPDQALRSALGEAVERYSALNVDLSDRVQRRAVGADPLRSRYPRCAPDEPCPDTLKGMVPELVTDYLRVRQAWNGKPVSIPRALVDLAYVPSAGDPIVALGISTGLAFHMDRARALWGGLAEVIERDAMMLTWWNRLAKPEVDLNSDLPDPLKERVRRARSAGMRPRIFEITSELRFPTAFCILEAPEYPFFVTGASTSGDLGSACCKALDEAVGVRLTMSVPIEPPSLEQFDWVGQLDHHTLLYADPRMRVGLSFLLDQERPPVPFDELAGQAFWPAPVDMFEFAGLSGRLLAAGFTVLWTDLTCEEVEPLGHVVRVIVPEAVPLSQAQAVRWLGCPRLAAAGGHAPGAPAAAFNPHPHPFA